METRWLKLLTVAAIAAGATACSDARAPVAPRSAAPVTMSPRVTRVGHSYYAAGYQLLIGKGQASVIRSDIIDEHGGRIRNSGSTVEFPAHALAGATLVMFAVQSQPYIMTNVYAVSLEGRTRGTLVTTFPVPVTLTVSYAEASLQVTDASQLQMGWLENDVLLGLVPSQVNARAKTLTSQVTHFTEFGPVTGMMQADPFGAN